MEFFWKCDRLKDVTLPDNLVYCGDVFGYGRGMYQLAEEDETDKLIYGDVTGDGVFTGY